MPGSGTELKFPLPLPSRMTWPMTCHGSDFPRSVEASRKTVLPGGPETFAENAAPVPTLAGVMTGIDVSANSGEVAVVTTARNGI